MLVLALLLVGPAAVLYGLAPTFELAVVAIALLGFVYLAVLSGTSTVCQLRAPRELRARIASLFMLGVGGGHAVGLVVQGWLGDRVGLPAVTAVTGLLLAGIVVAVRLARPDLLEAMEPRRPRQGMSIRSRRRTARTRAARVTTVARTVALTGPRRVVRVRSPPRRTAASTPSV